MTSVNQTAITNQMIKTMNNVENIDNRIGNLEHVVYELISNGGAGSSGYFIFVFGTAIYNNMYNIISEQLKDSDISVYQANRGVELSYDPNKYNIFACCTNSSQLGMSGSCNTIYLASYDYLPASSSAYANTSSPTTNDYYKVRRVGSQDSMELSVTNNNRIYLYNGFSVNISSLLVAIMPK